MENQQHIWRIGGNHTKEVIAKEIIQEIKNKAHDNISRDKANIIVYFSIGENISKIRII